MSFTHSLGFFFIFLITSSLIGCKPSHQEEAKKIIQELKAVSQVQDRAALQEYKACNTLKKNSFEPAIDSTTINPKFVFEEQKALKILENFNIDALSSEASNIYNYWVLNEIPRIEKLYNLTNKALGDITELNTPERPDAQHLLAVHSLQRSINDKLKLLYTHQEPWILNANFAREIFFH